MSDTVRAYTGGSYALELGGTPAGSLVRASGGDTFADVVEVVEADGTRSKRLGGVHVSDISLEPAGDLDPTLLEWLRASLEARFVTKDGAVLMMSADGALKQRLEFHNALVREVRFPALDATSKEAARIAVKLAPESTRRVPGSGSFQGSPGSKSFKSLLAANFRLQIDGLDCSRVSRIDELVVQAVVAEDAVGEVRQYDKVPVRLDYSDLVVTLAETGSEKFFDWHEHFVVRGQNDKSAERSGTIELLDPLLKASRLTLELRGLGIHRLVSTTSGEGLRTVTASMYCQSVSVAPPPVPPPPPAAPPPATADPPTSDAPPIATSDTIVGGRLTDEIVGRIGRLPPPTG